MVIFHHLLFLGTDESPFLHHVLQASPSYPVYPLRGYGFNNKKNYAETLP